jgi:hypothetical protein
MGSRGSLHAPVLIDARQLRADEELRVEIQPYRGFPFVSARVWYRGRTGSCLPGKNGLSIRVELLPWLRAVLERAEREALTSALLDEEAYESAGLEVPAELLDARGAAHND